MSPRPPTLTPHLGVQGKGMSRLGAPCQPCRATSQGGCYSRPAQRDLVMWLFQRGVKVSVGGCVLTLVTGAGKLPGGGWNVSGGPLGSCTSHVGTMASCQEVGTQPATGSRWPLITMGFLCARAKHRICFVHIGMCCNLCPAAPTHTEARVSPYLCCIGEGVPSWASTRPRCPEMAAAGSALGP